MALSPAPSKANELGKQQEVFHSSAHFLTKKNDSMLPSPPSSSSGFAAEFSESSNDVPESSSSRSNLHVETGSSSSQIKKKAKIRDRLKKLGRDLSKFRPIGDKSLPASPRVTVEEIRPQTMGVVEEPRSVLNTPSIGHTTLLGIVEEREDHSGAQATGTDTAANVIDPPEPTSLAKRIEALVGSLPFPTRNKGQPLPARESPNLPATDASGRPIPPPYASPIQDSRLLDILSSPDIMNGSTSRGSIWGILEGLLPPSHELRRVNGETSATSGGEEQNDRTSTEDRDSVFSDNSSVMVYSPLIPTNQDLVELAELVHVGVQEEPVEHLSPIVGTSWTTMWPLSLWYTAPPPTTTDVNLSSERPSGETVLSPQRTSIDSAGRPVRVQTVRAWVPSRSKISVQAMWWGYRLYLPPPVLDVLSDQTLEATKRAAMITTALTWFFNNLPINNLPAAVVPAALLLQRLAPFLGYIGTFISWSWSAIKSYDIGYGVTLTATWLLPIALIPGTWHEYDFPISPTQATPAPLVPMSPSSLTLPSLPTITSPLTSPTSTFSPLSPRSFEIQTMQSSPSAISYSSPPQTRYSPLSVGGTSTPLYARVLIEIPVSPIPEHISPIPSAPEAAPVPLGSPLMEQLLYGPIMHTVPLPDEDEVITFPQSPKRKRDGKSRAKALFTRSSQSK